LVDDVQVSKMAEFEQSMYEFMDEHHAKIEKELVETRDISDALKEALTKAIHEFKKKKVPEEWMVIKKS
jgi:F-type H+/Na+-transporting ATPase subunit alpha